MLQLFTKQIEDTYLRENFEKIETSFNDLVFTLGDFKFFEFRIPDAQEEYKLYHYLGFNPNDVIVTKAIGSSFEFNYNGFNDQYLTIKTTGSLYLRCFIGNMRGDEVTGTNAFSNITDEEGGSGGPGGGLSDFFKKEQVVTGGFLSAPTIELQGVPITDSEKVFVNGLYVNDTNYTIDGTDFTWNTPGDLRAGDIINIHFAS